MLNCVRVANKEFQIEQLNSLAEIKCVKVEI